MNSGASKAEELTSHEVTGMCRHDVEKSSFGFGVTESFQGLKVRRFDVPIDRIREEAQHGAGRLGRCCQATAHELFGFGVNWCTH